jgi:hypothetical protein
LIKLRPEQQEEESRMHDRSRFASREVTPTCISWSLFFLIIFQIVFFSFCSRYEEHFNGVCLQTQPHNYFHAHYNDRRLPRLRIMLTRRFAG